MKKLITFLFISVIALSSICAKSAVVNLDTTIEEVGVSYDLYYNDSNIADGTTDFAIDILSPLNEGGNTNPFRLIATSNMNNDLSINVDVTPQSFKTTINDGSEVYDSNITPEVENLLQMSILSAGKNDNETVYVFVLSWTGKDDLVAGDYVSNVNIEYTIN